MKIGKNFAGGFPFLQKSFIPHIIQKEMLEMITVAALWISKKNNVGTLTRTCEALNAQFVVPSARRMEAMIGNTPKYPPLLLAEKDIKNWIKFQSKQTRLIALETGGTPIGEFEPCNDVTILLGNETNGIPQWALDLAEIATIPQVGHCPCINVATAGSIAAYHFSGLLQKGCSE